MVVVIVFSLGVLACLDANCPSGHSLWMMLRLGVMLVSCKEYGLMRGVSVMLQAYRIGK